MQYHLVLIVLLGVEEENNFYAHFIMITLRSAPMLEVRLLHAENGGVSFQVESCHLQRPGGLDMMP